MKPIQTHYLDKLIPTIDNQMSYTWVRAALKISKDNMESILWLRMVDLLHDVYRYGGQTLP